MARASTWTNSDGLRVGFGRRNSVLDYAGTVRTMGNTEVITMEINAADMPAFTGSAVPAQHFRIPANSIVTGVTFLCTTTFADADANPTMTVGLVNSAGTAIDADGLLLGLTEASGKLTAGASVVGADDVGGDDAAYVGDLVGKVIGSSDGYIATVLDTGAWDSGAGMLTVTYIRPMPDSTPSDPIDSIVGSL